MLGGSSGVYAQLTGGVQEERNVGDFTYQKNKKRQSPEISQMYGAMITSRLVSGGEKTSYFYWETRERRDECLPRLLTKFIKPKVKLINKK